MFTNYVAWYISGYSYLQKYDMLVRQFFECLPEVQKAILKLINFISFPTFLIIMAVISLMALSIVLISPHQL